jgi:hypothetical protein
MIPSGKLQLSMPLCFAEGKSSLHQPVVLLQHFSQSIVW